MIKTDELEQLLTGYQNDCTKEQKKPSYRGLAMYIGTTAGTIRNICLGYYYYYKPYSDKPSHNRLIDNEDFDLVREVFN